MKETMKNIPEPTPPASPRKRRKALRVIAWTLCGIVLLAIAAVTAVTLWLTPERLTALVNRQASEYLDADVRASDIRFTLWSSFPNLRIEADSVSIISRTLRGLTPAQRSQLPSDAERLASTGHLKGSLNVMRLIGGVVALRDVEVSGLALNLVEYNDSINNYSILPPEKLKNLNMPDFSADTIRLHMLKPLRYYSAASGTDAMAEISTAEISRSDSNRYRIAIGGSADVRKGDADMMRRFPFRLDGNVNLSFHPLKVSTSGYNILLGDIKGRIDLDMNLENQPVIDNLICRFDGFNPIETLRYLPGVSVPGLESFDIDVDMAVSARLLKPFMIKSGEIPSLAVAFRSDNGKVGYRTSGGEYYDIDHLDLTGRLTVDGQHPDKSRLDIIRLDAEGEGAAINANGTMTGLGGDSQISLNLKGSGNLSRIARMIPSISNYGLKGDLTCDTKIGFRLSDFTGETVRRISADGDVNIRRFAINIPGGKGSGNASEVKIRFGGNAASLTGQKLKGGEATVAVILDKGALHLPGLDIEGSDINVTGSDGVPKGGNLYAIGTAYPLRYTLKAGNLRIRDAVDTLNVTAKGIRSEGSINPAGKRGIPDVKGFISMPSATLRHPAAEVRLSDATLSLTAGEGNSPKGHPVPATKQFTDNLKAIPHSQAYITADVPQKLRNLFSHLRLMVSAKASAGEVRTRSFPVRNRFYGLDLSATEDSVRIAPLKIRSQRTGATIAGSLAGLRDLMTGSRQAPLRLYLDLNLDTVDINQLARTYEQGLILTKGSAASLEAPRPLTLTASDTAAMLIPRNLTATIKASAKETVYTNLHLYNLATDVKVADGNAHVKNLTISSDFGHAFLDADYLSGNIREMNAAVSLGVLDIDVVTFFKRFHTLLLMMPQMRNLSGTISARADMGMHIFPDMFADMPSVNANLGIKGRGLTVHQDPFIRRITRMMLIRTSDDIHIDDMNVHASVHDNLLELYPFNFEFDRYKLRMEGINNFNGKLYYHIGVLKSPIPFGFGINITGMFHKPHLRFGGSAYKMEKGAEVAASVMESNNFNIPRELKYYMRMFVKKAAESDTTSSGDYIDFK